MEADFRFSLARLREYTEQVALLNGEDAEQNMAGQRFGALIANYLALVYRRMRVTAFTHTFGQISPIIPYIFTAPFYFARKIELGVMTQTAGAFGHVANALTFFVNYYTYLAGFKSVVDRLNSFDLAIDQAEALSKSGPARVARASDTPGSTLRMSIFSYRTENSSWTQNILYWPRVKTSPFRALQAPANQRCFVQSRESGPLARAAFTFLRVSA